MSTTNDKERIGILQVNREGKILARKLLGTGLKGGDFNSHTANKLVAVSDGFLFSVFPYSIVYKTDFNLIKEEEFLTFDLGDIQAPFPSIRWRLQMIFYMRSKIQVPSSMIQKGLGSTW
ncbi:MAG: hypothetical protein NTV01_09960 [Bacteroidia bacterium]|nr:hypothetical protein [Bacteroidia bacterium]